MKLFNNKKKTLVTHNGSFHTDDVFAAAVLTLYLEKENTSWEIIRTRDARIIEEADYVFDVGGAYDEAHNRFDHHQVGGAGKRENGIEYSSVGLVWKKFGVELSGSLAVAQMIEERLITPIDAFDNGFDLVENKMSVSPYYLQHLIGSMHPTWREGEAKSDEMFLKSMQFAREVLQREIIQAQDVTEASKKVEGAYEKSQDKRIIILDKNYPFEYVLHKHPEPLFVICPRQGSDAWGVKTVRENPKTFVNRKNLPAAWGGRRDEELQKISGVPDAIFCHKGLFLAVAKSKEGAIKLAQIALDS